MRAPLTVFLAFSTNLVFYAIETRFLLARFERRTRSEQNRPKVLNALNMATMEDLRAAFHDLKNDAAIRVVILTGSGEKAFIAGADIAELAKHDAASGKEYTHRGQNVLNLIENLGKPGIACINGFALGGGCEIAMACTMRLASENAKLGQPEGKLGIIPGDGGTQRLARLGGEGIGGAGGG